MRRMRSLCCARTVNGHAAATPPASVTMNSRRLIASPAAQHWVSYRLNLAFWKGSCPLWVKSRHVQRTSSCPLYPRKRHQMRHMECPLWAKSELMQRNKVLLFDHLGMSE